MQQSEYSDLPPMKADVTSSLVSLILSSELCQTSKRYFTVSFGENASLVVRQNDGERDEPIGDTKKWELSIY